MSEKRSQVIDDREGVRELNDELGRRREWFETVRHELVKRACRKQEKANLNFKSKSTSWTSMLDCVYGEFCEEVRMEEKIALMRLGWREFIKTL